MKNLRLLFLSFLLSSAFLLTSGTTFAATSQTSTASASSSVQSIHTSDTAQDVTPQTFGIACWLPHDVEIYTTGGESCYDQGGTIGNFSNLTQVNIPYLFGGVVSWNCDGNHVGTYGGRSWSGHCNS